MLYVQSEVILDRVARSQGRVTVARTGAGTPATVKMSIDKDRDGLMFVHSKVQLAIP